MFGQGDLENEFGYEGVICEGSSVQQEAAPSSEIPISGAPACDGLHPIIFGRSQILPSHVRCSRLRI